MVGPQIELTLHLASFPVWNHQISGKLVISGANEPTGGGVRLASDGRTLTIDGTYAYGDLNGNGLLKIYLQPTAGHFQYTLTDFAVYGDSGGFVRFPIDLASASGELNYAYPLQGPYQMSGDGSHTYFMGSSGDDTISNVAAYDWLRLGDGVDTLIVNGASSDFRLVSLVGSQFEDILKLESGQAPTQYGLDLSTVERIQFNDKWLAVDLSGNAGTAAKILGAVFGKESLQNAAYTGIALELVDKGVSASQLAGAALGARLGHSATSEQVVDLIYANLVGTLPSQSSRAVFVDLLESRAISRADLAVAAAMTPLNTVNIDLVGLSKRGLEYVPIDL
jgi:hypothetical protein